jgi:TonB family protein
MMNTPRNCGLGKCALMAALTLAGALELEAQDQKPVARVQVPPQYPYEMSRAGVGGRVQVGLVIGANGRTKDIRILRSTAREFERPTMQAVSKWSFQPGLKAGKPADFPISQVLEFNLNTPPVYPRALLIKEQEGMAEVRFSVDTRGRVIDIKVLGATQPEFAGAAAAAVLASTHGPAFADAPGQSTSQTQVFRFLPDGRGDALIDDATRKMLAQLKKNPEVATFSELDAPPVRKSGAEPQISPAVLAAVGFGRAQVEVYIDASGNVVLPQPTAATHPLLGYVAAQAVGSWKYEPPKKAGKRVATRGLLEITFGSKK